MSNPSVLPVTINGSSATITANSGELHVLKLDLSKEYIMNVGGVPENVTDAGQNYILNYIANKQSSKDRAFVHNGQDVYLIYGNGLTFPEEPGSSKFLNTLCFENSSHQKACGQFLPLRHGFTKNERASVYATLMVGVGAYIGLRAGGWLGSLMGVAGGSLMTVVAWHFFLPDDELEDIRQYAKLICNEYSCRPEEEMVITP